MIAITTNSNSKTKSTLYTSALFENGLELLISENLIFVEMKKTFISKMQSFRHWLVYTDISQLALELGIQSHSF
jgi:c-di-GMP-related signal transduction protein